MSNCLLLSVPVFSQFILNVWNAVVHTRSVSVEVLDLAETAEKDFFFFFVKCLIDISRIKIYEVPIYLAL